MTGAQNLKNGLRDLTMPIMGQFIIPRLTLVTFYLHANFGDFALAVPEI